MKTTRLIMAVALAFGLTLGLAGLASAAQISCGDCHSAPPVDSDNCSTDARGLHGVHTNYSSASMPEIGATTYFKCASCHSSTESTAPSATHNSGAVDYAGVSYAEGTNTCSNSCHANEGSTAVWGAFSNPAITLTCNSCHDDSSATLIDISGAHAGHVGSTIDISAIAGSSPLNGGNNACKNCHPDNSADGAVIGTDDGSVKTYTHASDGANVVEDNAAISLVAGTDTRGTGAADSCANVCHANKTALWSDTSLACDSCHYYDGTNPNGTDNGSATVGLGGGHNTHFDSTVNTSIGCSDCHTVPTDNGHVSALPVSASNATVTRTGMTLNGDNTCSASGTGCHGPGDSPVWGTTGNGCATCHNYPTGTSDWTAYNGHASRFDSVTNRHLPVSGWNPTTDTYTAVASDTGKCGLCHYATSDTTHNDGTVDTNEQGHGACVTPDFTINVNTTRVSADCSNVDCHSGKATPEWY